MILDDAQLSQQDAAHFHTALRSKLGGALALDALTRGDALDLFVLFSSIVTAIGNPGQANYIASNAGLEALAQRRRRAGLAGTAIMFGPIADAGYLARETRVADMLATALGSRHLTADEALQALPALLASRDAVGGIACVQWGALARFPAACRVAADDHLPKTAQADVGGGDLRSNLAEMTPEDGTQHVMAIIRAELSRILHLPAGNIAADRPIEDFGIDSLMTVELATALDARAGCSLPPLVLNEHATLRSVSTSLVRGLTGRGIRCSPIGWKYRNRASRNRPRTRPAAGRQGRGAGMSKPSQFGLAADALAGPAGKNRHGARGATTSDRRYPAPHAGQCRRPRRGAVYAPRGCVAETR